MRERKTGRRVESFHAKIYCIKVILYKASTEPYILLRIREIKKMHELPIIHRG